MTKPPTFTSADSLLGQFEGKRPSAPEWFEHVLSVRPDRKTFKYDGTSLEYLDWGGEDKPGLVFLHGDTAHADWWSFIAPYFANDFRCVALSWSGMGGSGWRDSYSFESFSMEVEALIAHTGLDAAGKVLVVAHSIGGGPALLAASRSEAIRGVITIDSVLIPPERMPDMPVPLFRSHKRYASLEEALTRFRFTPADTLNNLFIVDHIARHSLKEVEEDGRQAWTWRFDPGLWVTLKRDKLDQYPRNVKCPVAVLLGEESSLVNDDVVSYMKYCYPDGTPFVVIPDAGHHVMVDQPLALVAAVRALIARWP